MAFEQEDFGEILKFESINNNKKTVVLIISYPTMIKSSISKVYLNTCMKNLNCITFPKYFFKN